eukprot:CAMPEP_0182567144 /NCGR_PEP_ID=MMETSP1324-20130603/8431_1 /TAXON_ID=236786 /ORGANISM="Florenciella sp., Strain RCC1587" /LENGTH=364 /DNA_ID=CAMNT_0024781081 /DNA_START=182 /DNA_END=1276 /DNA_ORIENTATION=+
MASAPDGVDPAAWAALLKWSIAQTAEGDGTSSEPPAPMSKEKKEFLEAVMKDGVVDLVKRAGEILEALHDGTKPCREGTAIDDDATDRLVGLMGELMDIVEQIDFAMALVQIGGVPPLLAIIENGLVAEELRREALAVLATVAQNNPYAQDALMSQGALPIFVRIADSSASASTDAAADAAADASAPATPASNQLRLKALHAMSCLARGNAAAEAALVSAEVRGVETLESCLATDFIRLQRKATFVTSALILSDDADAAALAAYYGRLAPILVAQAETSGDIDLRENTVKALTTFANRGFGESIKEEYGARLDAVMALCEARSKGAGTPMAGAAAGGPVFDEDENGENATAELSLWAELRAALK